MPAGRNALATRRRTALRRSAWPAVVAVAGGLLTGCGDRPAPDPAARALAEGMARLDLAAVPVGNLSPAEATSRLRAAVQGLGQVRPAVRLAGVDPDHDGTSRATLDVTWQLAGRRWSYRTTAPLVEKDGRWKVTWSPAVIEPSLQPGERLTRTTTPATRGRILGAGDSVLVTERPVVRTGIDRARVDAARAEQSALQLAALVGVEPKPFAARVVAAGPQAFVEAVTLRRAEAPPAAKLAAIPGARGIEESRPLAITREFARPILGWVGEVTAEQLSTSGGRRSLGDLVGQAGLQARYDEVLRGGDGLEVRAVGAATPPGATASASASGDGSGAASASPPPAGSSRVVFRAAASPGADLRTTLDPALQSRAEAVLAGVRTAAAVVAVQPSTGHVLAAASGPGGNGYDTALLGHYPPGSTFKVASALALLRAGLTPQSPVDCPATLAVNGQTFKNYDSYPASRLGRIPLRSALAYSCNTAFLGQRDRVAQPALADAAASLGLGRSADLGVAAFTGSVPATAVANEHAASMIGQGRVEASPLAMAVVAASVGRGATVSPRLVLDAGPVAAASAGDAASPGTASPGTASPGTASPGAVGAGSSPSPSLSAAPPARPLTGAESEALRTMMRAVVTEGSGQALATLPGQPVMAKTGPPSTAPRNRRAPTPGCSRSGATWPSRCWSPTASPGREPQDR